MEDGACAFAGGALGAFFEGGGGYFGLNFFLYSFISLWHMAAMILHFISRRTMSLGFVGVLGLEERLRYDGLGLTKSRFYCG